MQLSPHQIAQLRVPADNSDANNSIETPIKKSKLGFHSHLKTAETPTVSLQSPATRLSIADVEA